MRSLVVLAFFYLAILISVRSTEHHQKLPDSLSESSVGSKDGNNAKVIDVKGGPESVVWIVQLSDLHFSVHHPDRARDFVSIVGPTLSMINPSLVLITGDLTDGKSKDLSVMKQDKMEWIEYKNAIDAVIKRSGLEKSIFYDLRGNHDNFGVPSLRGSFDFYSDYSINGQLGRTGNVNSVTLQSGERTHLFVGFDSTSSVGLRGPTNLFGHPTDQLLSELDVELSRWDFQFTKPVTKISFGHFPLSFSANSLAGKSLKDIFLKHSLSSYLCGHLHTKFGQNLKQHHQSMQHATIFDGLFQLNSHRLPSQCTTACPNGSLHAKEFWEWEMGDWRKSRAMRILAIDRGHVSIVDIDLKSGSKRTIILPTFPLDSRFMLATSSCHKYYCESIDPSSYNTVRALVFSVSPILSLVVRIYDSRSGYHDMVLETPMRKDTVNPGRGDLYIAPWNFRAFEDPSPDRYWLQIEAVDVMGRSSLTKLMPFSISGNSAKLSWTWKEFFAIGCQWAALYYPILWSVLTFIFGALSTSMVLRTFMRNRNTYLNVITDRSIVNITTWGLTQFSKDTLLWIGVISYLIYLLLFPWFLGQVFSADEERAYMTYRGWVMPKSFAMKKLEYIGFPDVMVVVLSHICFVLLPAILCIGAFAGEGEHHKMRSILGKKRDDLDQQVISDSGSDLPRGRRLIRKVALFACLVISLKHLKDCRSLMKTYEMNPLLHFPVYSFAIPLLLACAVYRTRKV